MLAEAPEVFDKEVVVSFLSSVILSIVVPLFAIGIYSSLRTMLSNNIAVPYVTEVELLA